MNERVAKIEGQVDTLKVVRPLTITVLGLILAVSLAGFALLGAQSIGQGTRLDAFRQDTAAQIQQLDQKVDAIPARLAEEFRAMRAEMSAQTSALADIATAARGQPTQVILVPAPESPSPQP